MNNLRSWPKSIAVIRHGHSEANLIRRDFFHTEKYKDFKDQFEKEYQALTLTSIHDKTFPSKELLEMAKQVSQNINPTRSDYDVNLTEEGIEQARQTGKKLSEYIDKPDLIYVSPYQRTRQTLKHIIESWPELEGVRILEDDRLREREHGHIDVYGMHELFLTFNPEYALYYKMSSEYEYRHPGGESVIDVKERVRNFVQSKLHNRLFTRDPDQTVMVVTHAGTKLAMRAYLENWTREDYLEARKNASPVNCGVTIYKSLPVQDPLAYRDNLKLDQYNLKLY